VQKDIAKGIVTPGTYFVLKFDFSKVVRSPNLNETNESLKGNITQSFERFYKTYSRLSGKDKEELYKNIVPGNPARSMEKCVEWVQDVLLEAQENRGKQLAGVEGVSNSLPLNNSSQSLIIKLSFIDLFAC
jgi:hypothetical protein